MRVIATAGHVDHGKSSLVLALTGTDPDRLEEEHRRGLTIDLGFAHTTVADDAGPEAIAFVDVPGHVRFLRNMLAGVGGVDACLFVVAATEGWKPQSEEHLRILELVGIHHGIIALTKVDVLDDPDLVELAVLEVAERVAGTFLAGAPIVPVAAPSGIGLDQLGAELAGLARLTPASPGSRTTPPVDRPRLRGTRQRDGGHWHVDRWCGRGRQQVVMEPAGRRARVRAIQTLGVPVGGIGPGNRVALNLAGVDRHELTRGDVVVTPGRWRATRVLDASLTVLRTVDHEVSRRGAYLAYVGSGEHAVRLRVLGAAALRPGTTGAVRLHLDAALPLLPGDRYVLRETGRDETVGGGEVLDIAPVVTASRGEARPRRRSRDQRARLGRGRRARAADRRAPAPTVGRWVVAPAALATGRGGRPRQAGGGGRRRRRAGRARRAPAGAARRARRRERHGNDGAGRRTCATRSPTIR